MYNIFLDVGNTNIVVGLFQEKKLLHTWRIRSNEHKTADEYYSLFQDFLADYQITLQDITDLVISSVVPKITHTFSLLWNDYKKRDPFIIHAGLNTGLQIGLSDPHTIGSDLLVAAVSAYHTYKKTCIILDMGTATTVTVVDQDGTFLGGSIISGLELTVNALLNNTALLTFTNSIDTASVKAIGNSTEAAIQSGIIYGYSGLVDNIIKHVIKELATDDYQILTTGGQANIIAKFSEYIQDITPNLLFDGMQIIYDLNK